MSTVEDIFAQIEGLTFSDKILVLADLAKKIQKGVNKNVKLSKEEKDAKPKKVMPPNPWNAFIAHMLKENPEMFEGVEKRSEQIKIISAYKKENEDEYANFVEEFRLIHPKPEGSVKSVSEDEGSSDPKPKRKYVKKAKVEDEDDVPKTKVSSVSDKAAEIKRKLAEKKAAETKVKPKVTKVDDFDPFAEISNTSTNNNNNHNNGSFNPFGDEEEPSELVDKVVKGKKYKFDPKTNELYDENFTVIGKFNPKLKSQIEEIE